MHAGCLSCHAQSCSGSRGSRHRDTPAVPPNGGWVSRKAANWVGSVCSLSLAVMVCFMRTNVPYPLIAVNAFLVRICPSPPLQ
jgi:hypothetical protein